MNLHKKYIVAQREVGRTERAWHIACYDFYRMEAEFARMEAELRKKYNLQQNETFDVATGNIVSEEQ